MITVFDISRSYLTTKTICGSLTMPTIGQHPLHPEVEEKVGIETWRYLVLRTNGLIMEYNMHVKVYREPWIHIHGHTHHVLGHEWHDHNYTHHCSEQIVKFKQYSQWPHYMASGHPCSVVGLQSLRDGKVWERILRTKGGWSFYSISIATLHPFPVHAILPLVYNIPKYTTIVSYGSYDTYWQVSKTTSILWITSYIASLSG